MVPGDGLDVVMLTGIFHRQKLIQPSNYQVSKNVVHFIKFGDIVVMTLNNLWCSDRYPNTD